MTASSNQAVEIPSDKETKHIVLVKPWYETYVPNNLTVSSNKEHDDQIQSDLNVECDSVISHCKITICNGFHDDKIDNVENNQLFNTTESNIVQSEQDHFDVYEEIGKNETFCDNEVAKIQYEEVKPRHPYDNFYLIHKSIIDYNGCKRCTHEELPPDPSPSPTLTEDTNTDLQVGLTALHFHSLILS